MIVIDSSTLISLAKINRIDILENDELICPEEVYTETVIEGIAKGIPDAIIIKRLFSKKIIKRKKIELKKNYIGISNTDSKILQLSKDENSKYIYCDDSKLSRKAESEGLRVKSSPDLIYKAYKNNRLTKEEYKNYIDKLHDKQRLSESTKNIYLNLIIGEKNDKSRKD